jgi:hypothetical protein
MLSPPDWHRISPPIGTAFRRGITSTPKIVMAVVFKKSAADR